MPRTHRWLFVLLGFFAIPLTADAADPTRKVLLVADAPPATFVPIVGGAGSAIRASVATSLLRKSLESTAWYGCELRYAADFLDMQPKQLAVYETVVLAQLVNPAAELWNKASDYAKAGGQLIVIPGGAEMLFKGRDKPPPGYDSDILPGRLRKWIEIEKTKTGVTWTWDALKAHPLLFDFGTWLKNPRIDFVGIPPRAWGYWDVAVKDESSVIVYYNDGPAKVRRPALLEKSLGTCGKLLLFTTTMDGLFDRQRFQFEDRPGKWNNYAESSFHLVLTNLVVRYMTEEYDLRGPASVKGQIISLTNKTNYKNAVRTIKAGDRTIEDRFDELTTKEKEIEVLGVANGEASSVRIKIAKDSSEETRVKGKRTSRRTRGNALDGQFLYGERTKDGWKYSLEDVAPTDEQKQALKDYAYFRGDDELLPKGKFKVGHEWKIDAEMFKKILGHRFQDIGAKGTGKFVRVEKDGDDTIAVLQIDFELTGTAKDGDMTRNIKVTAKNLVHRSLSTGYDLKSTGTGKLEIKSKGEIDGEKVDIEFTADLSDEETNKVKSSR